jgi:polysaccharide biosynthesis transport protein
MATLQTLPDAAVIPAAGSSGMANLAARSFLYAVFKHRRLVIGVFLLVFMLSLIAALSRPRVYRANTKVLVKIGEAVQLAPAEAPSRSVNVPLNTEVINTEAEIVKSRDVLARAVERLNIKPQAGMGVDEMVDNLRLALTVQPTPASNVLTISYLGRDPERAKNMVNAITDEYLGHHNEVYRNEGVHTFYTEQMPILEKEMKEAQQRLKKYLGDNGIVDVDQEIQIMNQDVQEQVKGLKAHLAKLAGTKSKLVEVQSQLEKTPVQVPYEEEWLSNPTAQTFKDKLAVLEIERFQVLQRYLPHDRHVRDKDEEISAIKHRIGQEQGRVLSKQTLQRNELHRELERNQKTLQVLIADLTERIDPLRERLESSRQRLHELRDKRFVINNLKQMADEKTYAFDLYFKKQEEARIAEAMKDHSMVNVTVVERATKPLDPENGFLLPILVGLLGGIGLAAGMAVLVEYLNRTLRFEEEVERYLELPVLAVIPDLHSLPEVAA